MSQTRILFQRDLERLSLLVIWQLRLWSWSFDAQQFGLTCVRRQLFKLTPKMSA